MPIIADKVPSAPTCHVFNLPPQNHPDGNVLTACVKSIESRMAVIISIRCFANSEANAALNYKYKQTNIRQQK